MKEVDQLRRQGRVKPLREILETMGQRVPQVIRQTQARLFQGITQYPRKILSVFEPHTEIIRKGKVNKPNEFGNLVRVREAENQIITHYEVFDTSVSSGGHPEWLLPTRAFTV